MKRRAFLILGVAGGLAAGAALWWRNAASPPPPPPRPIPPGAVAEFCGMLLSEHDGPKGQIFLRGETEPHWFASVRDALVYLRLPETPKNIAAVYVTDLARSEGNGTAQGTAWVAADQAFYVIESRRLGGMRLAEAFPFSDPAAARRFAEANGGRVVRLAEIPDAYLFGDAEAPPAQGRQAAGPGDLGPGDLGSGDLGRHQRPERGDGS